MVERVGALALVACFFLVSSAWPDIGVRSYCAGVHIVSSVSVCRNRARTFGCSPMWRYASCCWRTCRCNTIPREFVETTTSERIRGIPSGETSPGRGGWPGGRPATDPPTSLVPRTRRSWPRFARFVEVGYAEMLAEPRRTGPPLKTGLTLKHRHVVPGCSRSHSHPATNGLRKRYKMRDNTSSTVSPRGCPNFSFASSHLFAAKFLYTRRSRRWRTNLRKVVKFSWLRERIGSETGWKFQPVHRCSFSVTRS